MNPRHLSAGGGFQASASWKVPSTIAVPHFMPTPVKANPAIHSYTKCLVTPAFSCSVPGGRDASQDRQRDGMRQCLQTGNLASLRCVCNPPLTWRHKKNRHSTPNTLAFAPAQPLAHHWKTGKSGGTSRDTSATMKSTWTCRMQGTLMPESSVASYVPNQCSRGGPDRPAIGVISTHAA